MLPVHELIDPFSNKYIPGYPGVIIGEVSVILPNNLPFLYADNVDPVIDPFRVSPAAQAPDETSPIK